MLLTQFCYACGRPFGRCFALGIGLWGTAETPASTTRSRRRGLFHFWWCLTRRLRLRRKGERHFQIGRSHMNRWTVCLAAVFATLSLPSVFAQEGKVTVFAAASMKDALDEINAAFTKSTGIKVDASYAGSQTLVQLIEKGSRADVFLSADTNWMDYGVQKKFIKDDSCFFLLGNTLVLIASKDAKLGNVTIKPGFNLAQLAGNWPAPGSEDTELGVLME